jgi:hypothetical protein
MKVRYRVPSEATNTAGRYKRITAEVLAKEIEHAAERAGIGERTSLYSGDARDRETPSEPFRGSSREPDRRIDVEAIRRRDDWEFGCRDPLPFDRGSILRHFEESASR